MDQVTQVGSEEDALQGAGIEIKNRGSRGDDETEEFKVVYKKIYFPGGHVRFCK